MSAGLPPIGASPASSSAPSARERHDGGEDFASMLDARVDSTRTTTTRGASTRRRVVAERDDPGPGVALDSAPSTASRRILGDTVSVALDTLSCPPATTPEAARLPAGGGDPVATAPAPLPTPVAPNATTAGARAADAAPTPASHHAPALDGMDRVAPAKAHDADAPATGGTLGDDTSEAPGVGSASVRVLASSQSAVAARTPAPLTRPAKASLASASTPAPPAATVGPTAATTAAMAESPTTATTTTPGATPAPPTTSARPRAQSRSNDATEARPSPPAEAGTPIAVDPAAVAAHRPASAADVEVVVPPPADTSAARVGVPTDMPAIFGHRATLQFEGEAGIVGRLRISLNGDALRAVLVTDHAQDAGRLEARVVELQRALAERGFPDARVVVQAGGRSEPLASRAANRDAHTSSDPGRDRDRDEDGPSPRSQDGSRRRPRDFRGRTQ